MRAHGASSASARKPSETQRRIAIIIRERERLGPLLAALPQVEAVHPSQANFLLVKAVDADGFTAAAREGGYLLRRFPTSRGWNPACASRWARQSRTMACWRAEGGGMSAKIAFLDRDGTLIEEPPDFQVDSLAKLRLAQGVVPALRRLQDAGFELVMVSNQDGLGSDSFPQEAFDKPHEFLLRLLASQGIGFAEVFVCPHRAGDGCECRKPMTGLVNAFMRERPVDRAASVMIGDRETDLEFAGNLGVRGFRVDAADPGSWEKLAHEIVDAPRVGRCRAPPAETDIRAEVDLDARGRRKWPPASAFSITNAWSSSPSTAASRSS